MNMRHLSTCLLAVSVFWNLGCEKTPAPTVGSNNATGTQTVAALPATTTGQTTQNIADPHAVENRPWVLVVQRNMIADVAALKGLETYLSTATGKTILTQVVPTDEQLIELLRKDEAQLAYAEAWTFLVAHQKADMEVQTVVSQNGAPAMDAFWIGASTGKIKGLKDLKGKRIAFTSASSAEGFLFPLAALMDAGVLERQDDPEQVFGSVVFAGDDATALAGLRADKYDAAAVSGDAWTLDGGKGLKILAKLGPVPRASIAIKSSLAPDLKNKAAEAFIQLSDPANAALRKSVFGDVNFVKQPHYEYTDLLQRAIDTVDAEYPL